MDYTEFQKMLMERFEDEDLDDENENLFLWLMNAPEQYHNDDIMRDYFKDHPDASLKELDNYWETITPPGLAPGDDGSDLLDDDEEE